MYHCGIPFYNSRFFNMPGKKKVPKSGETGSGNTFYSSLWITFTYARSSGCLRCKKSYMRTGRMSGTHRIHLFLQCSVSFLYLKF